MKNLKEEMQFYFKGWKLTATKYKIAAIVAWIAFAAVGVSMIRGTNVFQAILGVILIGAVTTGIIITPAVLNEEDMWDEE